MGTLVEDFGNALRDRRLLVGLSQGELAKKASCSPSLISKIETGAVKTVRVDVARMYDRVLGARGELLKLLPEPDRYDARIVDLSISLEPHVPEKALIGRNRELRKVREFLHSSEGSRVCLITGPAGAGKTTLALHAVRDHHGQRLFLDLGGNTPGAEEPSVDACLNILLRSLGVDGEQIPSDRGLRIAVLRSAFQERPALLILDNVRSLSQVTPLLPRDPVSQVIITSRNKLNGLDHAARVAVQGLSADEAVRLFRESVGQRAEEESDALVSEVAERCQRLPLVLCIAAARFRASEGWTLTDFSRRLADAESWLGALQDGDRSVAAAFSMSVRSLDPQARRLLGLLALNPGRTLEVQDVAALAGTGTGEAWNLLDHLADAHLISRETSGRILVHDLLREYALREVLPTIDPEEHGAALRRLVEHKIAVAYACDAMLDPRRYRAIFTNAPSGTPAITDRAGALAWIGEQWPCLVRLCRIAFDHGLHDQCWRLAFVLRGYFYLAKLWDPWIVTHHLAADAARALDDARRLGVVFNNLGLAHADRGDQADALGFFWQASVIYQELDDEFGITTSRSNIAWTLLYQGDHEHARAMFETVLGEYRAQGSIRNAAIALRALSLVESELEMSDEAIMHADEAVEESLSLDLPLDLVMAMNCRAWAHFVAGDHDVAEDEYGRAITTGLDCGSPYETARAIVGLGNVFAQRGQAEEAAQYWNWADDFYARLDPIMIAESRIRTSLANRSGPRPRPALPPKRASHLPVPSAPGRGRD